MIPFRGWVGYNINCSFPFRPIAGLSFAYWDLVLRESPQEKDWDKGNQWDHWAPPRCLRQVYTSTRRKWWWGNARICLTQDQPVINLLIAEQKRNESLLDLTDWRASGERRRNHGPFFRYISQPPGMLSPCVIKKWSRLCIIKDISNS